MGQTSSSPYRGSERPPYTPHNTPAGPPPPPEHQRNPWAPPPAPPAGPGRAQTEPPPVSQRNPWAPPPGQGPPGGPGSHEDAQLQAAMEQSAMEAAIQASLRSAAAESPRHQPPAAAAGAAASPSRQQAPQPAAAGPSSSAVDVEEQRILEAAIQASLRESSGAAGVSSRPQTAPARGATPTPTAPQVNEDFFSPFVTSTVDSAQEDTDRAIAIALAEEEGNNSGRGGKDAAKQEERDREIARKLQEDFDREAAAPPPAVPNSPAQQPGATASPAARPASAGASSSQNVCSGCGQPLASIFSFASGNVISAMGRKWHPQCFKCGGCKRPICEPVFSIKDNVVPYHPACFTNRFHPKCSVCNDFIPPRADGRIEYNENRYWGHKFCRSHMTDGTPRCFTCDRLQSSTDCGEFVKLQDDRHACLVCLDTIVADTAACQPLYYDILAFYQSLGMPLPAKPPLMLVENTALNDAEGKEGRERRQGPVFHTRGLCLTEIHQRVRTVVQSGGGGRPWFVTPEVVQIPETRATVTAILVLFGMPRLLTGSVLAHELMHAWIKLSSAGAQDMLLHLEPQVEEGLCQLMAHLWLDAQEPHMFGMQGHGTLELKAYFSHQIHVDPSPIYGDGFRAALASYRKHGLQPLLSHVRMTGQLPD